MDEKDFEEVHERFNELMELITSKEFSDLSESEQDKLLDELIDLSVENAKKGLAIGMLFDKGNETLTLGEALNHFTRDEIRNLLRKALTGNAVQVSKLNEDDLQDLLHRLENGEITEEDKILLKTLAPDILAKEQSMMQSFDQFDLLTSFLEFYEKEDASAGLISKKVAPEPFINNAKCLVLACALADKSSNIRHIFEKHGIDRVMLMVKDILEDLTTIIIGYGQENDKDPTLVMLALCEVLKIMTSVSRINSKNMPIDQFKTLAEALFYNIDAYGAEKKLTDEQLSVILNADSEQFNTAPANAGKAEFRNNKKDFRSLLLDEDE